MRRSEANAMKRTLSSVWIAVSLFYVMGVMTTWAAPNAPPVARNDSFSVSEDLVLSVAAPGMLSNDTDANNDTLTAILVSQPTNGTLTFNANGSFTYTPRANFNGTDSFTYRANDGRVNSSNATVVITVNAVNDPPVSGSDTYSINEDNPLVVLLPGVLANDSDVDGDVFTAVLSHSPTNGTLLFNTNGSFIYMPGTNFHGTDVFTYAARDPTGRISGNVVVITVNSVNDLPAAQDLSVTTAANAVVPIALLGTDGDGDPLTFRIESSPRYGTLSGTGSNLTYNPSGAVACDDSFTYTVSDGTARSSAAIVKLVVIPEITLTIGRQTNESIVLKFNACSDHLYQIQSITNLGVLSAFSVIGTMRGAEPQTSFTVPPDLLSEHRFFRVQRLDFAEDQDGDGLPNFHEFEGGTGINDYFNGILPTLTIVSGNNQTNSANLFLPKPLVVQVTDRNGQPLTNAPVTFSVVQGDATLAKSFTRTRSQSFQVRTGRDGIAEVFCRLGASLDAVSRVNATASGGGATINVTFAAMSIARQPEGMLLQGAPDSLAVDALFDIDPVGVPDNEIEDRLIVTRLDVYVEGDATVAQVNSALEGVGGGIVTMRRNFPAITVAIPPPMDVTDLLAASETLKRSLGINMASVAHAAAPKTLPPKPAGDISNLLQSNRVDHLLPTRFPAAWNAAHLATNNCSGRKVNVLITDHFKPREPNRFYDEIPRSNFDFSGQTVSEGVLASAPHGFDVTTTMAARFDDSNPTGANPFPDCLNIHAIAIPKLTDVQKLVVALSSFPSGKFLWNYSAGYPDGCVDENGVPRQCLADEVSSETFIEAPLNRAYAAAAWKSATKERWNDFLMIVAAGNERDAPNTMIYSGLGIAALDSPMSFATMEDAEFAFAASNPVWWDPDAGFASYPPLAAGPFDMLKLTTYLSVFGKGAGADNVLMVGSTTNAVNFAGLKESAFSDSGATIYAVGEQVFTLEGDQDGTSFSTPQVTALVAYMWMLSPELRDNHPAQVTRQAILANARAVSQTGGSTARMNVIDAYATILSLDKTLPPTKESAPVRFAIMDISGPNGQPDLVFDEWDLVSHLANGVAKAQPVNGSAADYGRSDLNGDGFTGGSGTQPFDLDRSGSTQFGQTDMNGIAIRNIDGEVREFTKSSLTDLDILCYYAYSDDMYSNDPEARSERADLLHDLCVLCGSSPHNSPLLAARLAVGQCEEITVAVQPNPAHAITRKQLQFTATVTGSDNHSVTWEATGGTINTNGLFTAGTTRGTFVVTATSVADPAKFDVAAVTVDTVTVTVSPATATVQLYEGGQQFTAHVTGTLDTRVWWESQGGVLSEDGVFVGGQPGTFEVKAISVADPATFGVATVTVRGIRLYTTMSEDTAICGVPNEPCATPLPCYHLAYEPGRQFSFSEAENPPVGVNWSVSGGGTIDTNGVFTMGTTFGGPFEVRATSKTDATLFGRMWFMIPSPKLVGHCYLLFDDVWIGWGISCTKNLNGLTIEASYDDRLFDLYGKCSSSAPYCDLVAHGELTAPGSYPVQVTLTGPVGLSQSLQWLITRAEDGVFTLTGPGCHIEYP